MYIQARNWSQIKFFTTLVWPLLSHSFSGNLVGVNLSSSLNHCSFPHFSPFIHIMPSFWNVLSTFSVLSVLFFSLKSTSIVISLASPIKNLFHAATFYANIICMPLTLESELIQDDNNVYLLPYPLEPCNSSSLTPTTQQISGMRFLITNLPCPSYLNGLNFN